MTTLRDLIAKHDDRTLINLVMVLTGGAANPAVVSAQLQRLRTEAKLKEK